MKLTETDDLLTGRSVPIWSWFFGSVFMFAFFGVIISFTLAVWSNPSNFFGGPDEKLVERALSLIVFLILIVGTLVFLSYLASLIATPITTVTVERATGAVMIMHRSIFTSDGKGYLVSQIKWFEVKTVTGERSRKFIAIRLINGDLIQIDSGSEKDMRDVVDRFNRFLKSIQTD